MMATFRALTVWPQQDTPNRRSRATFRNGWGDTLGLLDEELRHLGGHDVVIEAFFREQDLRLDGMPRSDAQSPWHPGVIVTFETKRLGQLRYATDSCDWWQHNVRSIALGLEALRAVDRYGITQRGEQYQGYKALGAGMPMPSAAMTIEEAARFLIEHGEWGAEQAELDEIIGMPEAISAYYREAAKKLHPDKGGDAELFKRLTEAKRLLDAEASAATAR